MRVMPLEIEHPERIGLLLDFGNCRKQKTNSIGKGLPWGFRPGSAPGKENHLEYCRKRIPVPEDIGELVQGNANKTLSWRKLQLNKMFANRGGAPGWATKICDIPERVEGLRSFQRNSRIFRMNVFSE